MSQGVRVDEEHHDRYANESTLYRRDYVTMVVYDGIAKRS